MEHETEHEVQEEPTEAQQVEVRRATPQPEVTPTVEPVTANVPSSPRHSPMVRWFIPALLIVLLLVAAGGWWYGLSAHQTYNENQNINGDEYQAVFLTNGQVYFGKLTDLNHKYITITDIYYLQVQQNNGSLQDASGSNATGSQISLAKLGNELHGPEDKMYIASDQMLFWENLKNDSKVVQAITKYQNQ